MFGRGTNKTAKNIVYAKHIMDQLQTTDPGSTLSKLGPAIIDLLMEVYHPATMSKAAALSTIQSAVERSVNRDIRFKRIAEDGAAGSRRPRHE